MTNEYLQVELRRLQSENAKLRAALKENGRHARRIQRAYDCALLLAGWHIMNQPTDRQSARALGIAQRQFQNAMALLKLARVCDQSGRWLHHDLPNIEARLEDGIVAANAAPEAYFSKGPNHMRQ